MTAFIGANKIVTDACFSAGDEKYDVLPGNIRDLLKFSIAKAIKDMESSAAQKKTPLKPKTIVKRDWFLKKLNGFKIDDKCQIWMSRAIIATVVNQKVKLDKGKDDPHEFRKITMRIYAPDCMYTKELA